MRRLMLLRHAKTEADSPTGRDHDRRLDPRGRQDAAQMGEWMVSQDLLPGLSLVSTATRTQETWQLLAAGIKARPVQRLEELYAAEPAALLHAIHDVQPSETSSLMIVAHNPGLHELALMLIAEGDAGGRDGLARNLPTAGLVVIDFAVDDWRNVAFQTGTLAIFASPATLRGGNRD